MPELSRRRLLQGGALTALAVAAADLALELAPTARAAGPAWSPPGLDAMAGDWQPVGGIVHQPEISNFWGGLQAGGNIAGFQRLTMAPYSQAGSACDMTFDGAVLTSQYVRWYPYQIHRLAETASGLRVQSGTRMAFEANQVLLTVKVTNPTTAQVSTNVSVALNPLIRKYTSGWNWQIPRPSDQNFTAQLTGTAPNQNLLVSDNTGPAVTAFALSPSPQSLSVNGVGGTAGWTLTVAAGATATINIVIAIGDTSTGRPLTNRSDATAALSAANSSISSFSNVFTAAETGWANRWNDAFTPGNTHYSGYLPVIATDHPAIDRLYYMSVLSVLACERTNLGPAFNGFLGRPSGGLSGFDRIYTTGANEFGGTTMFFWDTSYCSALLALLDPQMLKALTSYFLTLDIHTCYGIDALTGNRVGNFYSANDLTVTTTALNYVKLTGDWTYLSSTVRGTSVLQLLTAAATYWQKFVPGGQQLADYGAPINLLEVLPRYTNQVASLNPGNVWLMRQVADLQARSNNAGQASSLRTSVNNLLPNVLAHAAVPRHDRRCAGLQQGAVGHRDLRDLLRRQHLHRPRRSRVEAVVPTGVRSERPGARRRAHRQRRPPGVQRHRGRGVRRSHHHRRVRIRPRRPADRAEGRRHRAGHQRDPLGGVVQRSRLHHHQRLCWTDHRMIRYEAEPCHAVTAAVGTGYRPALAGLPPGQVLAVDGAAAVDWDAVGAGICHALAARELTAKQIDMREHFAPWPDILALTASGVLPDDPDFAPLSQEGLDGFFAAIPEAETAPDTVTVVFGPGAALVAHDHLWYADLPKRYAEVGMTAGAGRNLGQPAGTGPGTTRRLFYIDWPVLDRHRDAVLTDIGLWLDTQNPQAPAWLDGPALRAALADLAARPFRTRPTFNTTSWGGHWAQRRLGVNPQAPNTAVGYELIAPESGILIGGPDGARVEVPLEALVALHPEEVLGKSVYAKFGISFPIRFDYLDTAGGGNLSVHCHPRQDYMHRVFGWPYTQHETYYMMVGGAGCRVFLGLRQDADLEAFRREADRAVQDGVPFDVERYVQTFPAEAHQLFLIPAGTPHGSGAGNVVLEISATPYLYSLRFYDWLRRDREGRQRPVHVGHAFDNLDATRSGDAVARDLVPQPRTVRSGARWREEVLGRLPEMFFEVRRVDLAADAAMDDTTDDRFHVLNVVEGEGIRLETASGHQCVLAYAETLTVPAAVGAYLVRAMGPDRVRYVKAMVA